MSLWGHLLRSLLLPGLLVALLLGGLTRGVAAWLGAKIGGRPAFPAWQPLEEIVHLARKARQVSPGARALVACPALLALAALSWALGMLPWPRWLLGQELPAGLVLYLFLLTVAPVARLVGAGLSASTPAAIGARRQVAVEMARLWPVLVAGIALPLFSGSFSLSPTVALSGWSALVGVAVAGILLVTLPWTLWDHDAYGAPLAGVGGRVLALFRAVDLLELVAQVGLVAVALRTSGLFPSTQEGWPLLLAVVAAVLALTVFETLGHRPILPEAARLYTRWVLPAAVVVALVAWLFRL